MPVPLSQTYGKQDSPPKKDTVLHIEITRTVALWPRKILVQWILRNPTSGNGYVFTLYRSSSLSGPWYEVGSVIDNYLFVDNTFEAPNNQTQDDLFSLRRTVYYRVLVTHPVDGTTEAIRKVEAATDRRRAGIIRKLRRDAAVALRKGSGTEVAILKRRWWGEPCTCRSKVGIATRAHHAPCNGTGIITGYWDPVYGFATRSSDSVNVATNEKGNEESKFIQVKMLDIPEVSRYDILVFLRDNKRFIVENVLPTEIHAITVHQELQVSELARSSREYNLIVDPWHDPEWF